MHDINIKVPIPCKEKWGCMTNVEVGKFCNVCNKVVVDFTSMTNEEVKDYFLKFRQQRVCGYFKPNQIRQRYNKFQQVLINLYNYIERVIELKLIRLTCLLFISFALALSGCGSGAMGTVVTNDTVPANIVDSLKLDTTNQNLNKDTIKNERKKP